MTGFALCLTVLCALDPYVFSGESERPPSEHRDWDTRCGKCDVGLNAAVLAGPKAAVLLSSPSRGVEAHLGRRCESTSLQPALRVLPFLAAHGLFDPRDRPPMVCDRQGSSPPAGAAGERAQAVPPRAPRRARCVVPRLGRPGSPGRTASAGRAFCGERCRQRAHVAPA